MTFGALSVTVLHVGWDGVTRDDHNNPVAGVLSTEVLAGCNLQQRSSDELLEERATTVTSWTLFAPPPAAPLTARDQFRIDAAAAHVEPDAGETFATFDLVGVPDVLDHIDGVTHHLELWLERAAL